MGLKDFDASKIQSWRYSDLGTSQQSQNFSDGHSGTNVTGKRDLIYEKFLGTEGDNIIVRPDSTEFDDNVGTLGSPQYANVKGGPAGLIDFPTPYDPSSGGIHGGTVPSITGATPPHQDEHSTFDDDVGVLGTPQYANVKGGPAGLIDFPLSYDPRIGGIHGGVMGVSGGGAQPPHPEDHSTFDDNVGELGSPQYANVKGGPFGLIDFPLSYDPRVGGIHGGIESPTPAQPPHPEDHSLLDDNVGTLESPQSFTNSGFVVTGRRDMISDKFVSSTNMLAGDDTIFEPNVTDTPLNPLTQQQNYTVTNPAGEYTITGLKGAKIPGWELQKGLSLILTNWSDMVDAKTLISYKVPRIGKNATHGHLEIPYSYHNFGSTSVDAEAFSYGSLSPNIGWTVELERGGNAVDGIVKDYEKILKSGDMWKRFVQKQSDMQVMGTITIGSDKVFGFEAAFDSFNTLDYLAAWGSTAQPYRLGSIMQGVPRYSENTPMMTSNAGKGQKWGGFPLPSTGWYDEIDKWMPDGDAVDFNKSDGKDFHKDSKMLYLYKSFILTDPDPVNAFGSSAWATGFVTNYWNSISDPYPIAPSMNIVQSKAWVNENLVYGGESEIGAQFKYSTNVEEGSVVTEADHGKYSFFSKSAPVSSTGNHLDEYWIETVKEEIEASDFVEMPEELMNLRWRHESAEKPPLVTRTDVEGGENTLEKFSKDTRGLVNKYSTLGYSHLGKEANLGTPEAPKLQDITYENTLHSPSEFNHQHRYPDQPPFVEFYDVVESVAGPGWKAEKGIRKEGQDKVYAIGKQGMSVQNDENKVAPLKPIHKYGFRGQINEDSNDSLFGDHVDQVNALPYGSSDEDADFISLIFRDITNKKDIQFRAIFTEDITDTITPSWNPINYIGRTTPVYTYQNTSRSISFGFTIFPKTKQEFPILLEKINYLVGLCYPNLDTYFRSSGPLIKLTVGDIVRKQLGFLSECSVTFPSSESPWETDRGLQFTKKIDVSIGFNYIGDNIPVSKGVHYNLDWLDGKHYTEAGVAWKEGPTRKDKGDISKLKMGGEQGIYASAPKGVARAE